MLFPVLALILLILSGVLILKDFSEGKEYSWPRVMAILALDIFVVIASSYG